MSKTRVNWPENLIGDIARQRAVLFIGSGVSKHAIDKTGAKPLGWVEFLKSASKKVPKQFRPEIAALITDGDLLTACQLIRDALGPTSFHSCLKDSYLRPGFRPARIHELLIKLGVRYVLTPNFDKIYEDKLGQTHNSTALIKKYTDSDLAEALRGSDPLIIKVHGSIDEPSAMIFTRKDYAEARTKHRHFYAILEALTLTHTFLFIGCGLNDPDIRLILEDHAFRYSFGPSHYFVTAHQPQKVHTYSCIEKCQNIKILTYDSAYNHRYLVDSLDDLSTRISAARTVLSTTGRW